MGLDEQIRRRDAMLEALESAEGLPRGLVDVVQRLYRDEHVDIEVLYEDLDQIRGLVSEENEDHVLDVMDLVVGSCLPEYRIGPYQWGDSRNVFTQRNREGTP